MAKKRFGQFSAIIAAGNNPLFSLKVKHQPNLNPKTNQQINLTKQQILIYILVLYSLMGEKIYLEARKENLENEIHQVLNQI